MLKPTFTKEFIDSRIYTINYCFNLNFKKLVKKYDSNQDIKDYVFHKSLYDNLSKRLKQYRNNSHHKTYLQLSSLCKDTEKEIASLYDKVCKIEEVSIILKKHESDLLCLQKLNDKSFKIEKHFDVVLFHIEDEFDPNGIDILHIKCDEGYDNVMIDISHDNLLEKLVGHNLQTISEISFIRTYVYNTHDRNIIITDCKSIVKYSQWVKDSENLLLDEKYAKHISTLLDNVSFKDVSGKKPDWVENYVLLQ